MEPSHGLLLRFIHFEFAHRHFVLIALAAGEHLVTNIHVAATPCKTLLEQNLIIAHLEFIGCESKFVVLEILLLAIESIALALAVAALRASFLIAV